MNDQARPNGIGPDGLLDEDRELLQALSEGDDETKERELYEHLDRARASGISPLSHEEIVAQVEARFAERRRSL